MFGLGFVGFCWVGEKGFTWGLGGRRRRVGAGVEICLFYLFFGFVVCFKDS